MVGRRASAGLVVIAAALLGLMPVSAQTPKPFPSPAPPTAPATKSPPAGGASSAPFPTEAVLGAPVFPSAEFITSYDAGRGQRFYLYGAGAPFLDVVTFYRTSLKQRGEVLFETPPTHQFETGRFRDETMAFPPSVTIKDYTFGGSAGYPNPAPGGKPARFPTIIQIVGVPQG